MRPGSWTHKRGQRRRDIETSCQEQKIIMGGRSQRSGSSYSDKDDSSRQELLRNRRRRNRESAQRTRVRELEQRKELVKRAAAVESVNAHLKMKVKSSSTHLKIMADVIIDKWGIEAVPKDVRVKFLQAHKEVSGEKMVREGHERKSKSRVDDFENEKSVAELAEILDKIICGEWSHSSKN